MDDNLALSHRVMNFITQADSLDDSEATREERFETQKWSKISEAIVDQLISSREILTTWQIPKIEELVHAIPDTITDFIDARFTRDVVREVPGYVDRLLKLWRLDAPQIPSQTTNSYLREAVRTYVFGFPLASVALSRAAMEQALKEQMGFQGTGTFISMNQLLNEAESAQVIRDKTIREMAREVANEANDVLHEKPTDIELAYDTLVKLRGVLQHVFAED